MKEVKVLEKITELILEEIAPEIGKELVEPEFGKIEKITIPEHEFEIHFKTEKGIVIIGVGPAGAYFKEAYHD